MWSRRKFFQMVGAAPVAAQIPVDKIMGGEYKSYISNKYPPGTSAPSINKEEIAHKMRAEAEHLAKLRASYEKMARGEFTEEQLNKMGRNTLLGGNQYNLEHLVSISPAAKRFLQNRYEFEARKSRYMHNAKLLLEELLGIKKRPNYEDTQLPEDNHY